MRLPSKNFTVSLDHVIYFLSIHKAEFFNPLAGARMRNPFSEKLGRNNFICNFITGEFAKKTKPKKAPKNTQVTILVCVYFNIKCKLRKAAL